MNHEAPVLSAVPSTLRIPLAARALGGRRFPDMAVDDRHAAAALARMGDDGRQWLNDGQTVYGTLARTRRFREQAQAFIARVPTAHVINLGCGLSDYLQWLDNGRMHMTDADLPEVMAIRHDIMPRQHDRHVLTNVDLTSPDWWENLALPTERNAEPVFLICEGVFMYLEPATVQAVLATFGERAPAGSVFTFDAMCWLVVGRARHHTSVKHTDAEFKWGPRGLTDLTRPHPRLALRATHEVMGGYNLFYRLMQPAFRAVTGVPFYGVYTLEALPD